MARRKPALVHGLAVVDKPAGVTSHDVVGMLRRHFHERRVGHAGTLDPDATGVLLVGVGNATRLLRFLTALGKTYTAEVVLGVETSTLDDSGEITARHDMPGITLQQVRDVVTAHLTGPIMQVPPMVSAPSTTRPVFAMTCALVSWPLRMVIAPTVSFRRVMVPPLMALS